MGWGNGKGWQNNGKNNWNSNQAPYGGGRGRRWFNNFGNFGNGGLGGNSGNGPFGSLANQFTNMVGELDAFGKMARIGQALATTTDNTAGATQASPGNAGAVANLATGSTPSVNQSSANFDTLVDRLGSVLSQNPTPNGNSNNVSGTQANANATPGTMPGPAPQPNAAPLVGSSSTDFDSMLQASNVFQQVQTNVNSLRTDVNGMQTHVRDLASRQEAGFNRIAELIKTNRHVSSSPEEPELPVHDNDDGASLIDIAVHKKFFELINLSTDSQTIRNAAALFETDGRFHHVPIRDWWQKAFLAKRITAWSTLLSDFGIDFEKLEITSRVEILAAMQSKWGKSFEFLPTPAASGLRTSGG